MNPEEVSKRILTAYPDARISIEGEDCSFSVSIVSDTFAGMNTLERQRSILGLFKEDLSSGALHALSIEANLPGE